MKIEEHIEELEARLNELNWHERRIGSPNATHESWGQSVELHQFRQVFVYRTSNKYQASGENHEIHGLAILKRRKSMADYFQPEGVTIWEGSFAEPNSEGLIVHQEDVELDSLIRLLHEKIRVKLSN